MGRVYLPAADRARFGYDDEMFARREVNDAFRRLMAAEVDLAEGHLRRGLPLVRWMPPELQLDVALFIHGGLAILRAIRQQNYDVWTSRPADFHKDQAVAAGEMLVGTEAGPGSGRRDMTHAAEEILVSHRACRRLSGQAGSNFPAAFCLLPPAKRQAMHALYAFMRHSDDLADDPPPGRSPSEMLRQWRGAVEEALLGDRLSGDGTLAEVDPRGRTILPAVVQTVREFQIPPESLLAVLDGVEMDLEPRVYATFDELAVYCERVASAVGMACIHIWGFSCRTRPGTQPQRRPGPATDQHPPRLERRRPAGTRLPAVGRHQRLRLFRGGTSKRRGEPAVPAADGNGNRAGRAVLS